VTITVPVAAAGPMGDVLVGHLEEAGLPVADLDTQVRDDEHVALVATLVGSGVLDAELDALVEHLGRVHGIDHATWQRSTHD
jgi:putative Mg2+ transporter-C (MgtC) family protein